MSPENVLRCMKGRSKSQTVEQISVTKDEHDETTNDPSDDPRSADEQEDNE